MYLILAIEWTWPSCKCPLSKVITLENNVDNLLDYMTILSEVNVLEYAWIAT